MTKILLVEDDKSLREIYGVRLLAEGYDIVSAGDGEEALAIAIKDRPQLILSDVMMPKISGFDMLDILRSTTETRDIKVIMMTALSSEDQRQRGESLGADRYLVKSQVGIEDVVRTVHEVLADAPGSASAAPAASSTPSADTPVGGAAASSQPEPAAAPTPTPAAPATPSTTQTPSNTSSSSVTVPPRPTATDNTQASAPQPAAQVPTADTNDSAAMPQPTAPFSTPRPAGLGDRVIQPIAPSTEQTDTATEDLAQRMQRELGGDSAAADAPATPVAPSPQPETPAAPEQPPTPATPAPEPQTAASNPVADTASQPTDATADKNAPRQPIAANMDTSTPADQPRETAGEFEETPRSDSNS